MRHGVGQFIRGKLVVDGTFAAQPGLQPVKSALPSPLVSNSLAIFRIFQLCDVGDFILVGGFLIDQVTLCRAVNKYPFTIKFLIATGSFVHVVMQRRQFTAVKVASPEASEV